jgi:hypothetical protein
MKIPAKSFQDLLVWKKHYNLYLEEINKMLDAHSKSILTPDFLRIVVQSY